MLPDADRRLHWEGCRNVRDLGGLPTVHGGRVAWGALVRADSLCRLTAAGRRALIEHGVRTVLDVRFPSEVALEPHPFRGGAGGVRYLNVPVNAGRTPAEDDAVSAAFAAVRTREEANRLALDLNAVGFARIVVAFARAPGGGVVVHCHAGKDRTGLAAALLLALVGVPDDAIAADYALSADAVGAAAEPPPTAEPSEDLPWWARPRHHRDCPPEAMLAMLAHLRGSHGGPGPYLLRGGATPADLAVARARLLGQL
jgi:protein-tyrosine phosphatase